MKFLRSTFTCFGAWFYFAFISVFILWLIYISYKNQGYFNAEDLKVGLVLYLVLMVPFVIILPICCQSIEIDNYQITLYFSFIKLRSFKWGDIKQVGIGNAKAGVGTYKRFIYVSSREVSLKDHNDIMSVKDYHNFITFEYSDEKYKYLVDTLPKDLKIIKVDGVTQ